MEQPSANVEQALTVTRAKLLEAKAKREAGYLFPLTLSGGVARVRVPNIADRAVYGKLPSSIQSILAEELLRSGGEAPKLKDVQDAVHRLADAVEQQTILANQMCVMGFVEPRLVLTEAETNVDPEAAWVEDVHLEDRLAYLELVLAGERAAAMRLKPFPVESMGPLPGEPGH